MNDPVAIAKAGVNGDNRADINPTELCRNDRRLAKLSPHPQPQPSPAYTGEGSIVTEMVSNHFRNTR